MERITSNRDTFARRNVLKALGATALASTGALAFSRAATAIAEERSETAERLSYYSDYFSFVGEDAYGKVAFALDNNRGQDGDAFQAEHFLVLHDQKTGWIELEGNGFYPNAGVLDMIPDSAYFSFSGTAETGLRATSERNRLALEVAPIPRVLVRARSDGLFWLGSASARLRWDGRLIPGRVIYEYFQRQGWNRLTRKYIGQWRDFHGLYFAVEGGGDLYVHSQKIRDEEPLNGNVVGFAALAGEGQVMEALSITASDSSQALGFFRWPGAWHAEFKLCAS